MMDYVITRMAPDSLEHHGIKGQKWGVRRFENEDGTLTEESRARYRGDAEKARKEIGDASRKQGIGMGTNEAAWLRSGLNGKKYRQLEKAVSKASKQAGSEYGKTFDRKGDKKNRVNAARELADAIASSSIQYINENFGKEERERAKAFVYARFVQEQDRQLRSQFGKINK